MPPCTLATKMPHSCRWEARSKKTLSFFFPELSPSHQSQSHTVNSCTGLVHTSSIPRLEYFQVKGILSNSLSIKKKRCLMEVVMHPCLAEGWFRVYLHYDYDLIQGRRFFFYHQTIRCLLIWFSMVQYNVYIRFQLEVRMSRVCRLCRHGHTWLDCVHLAGNATLVSTSGFSSEHPKTFMSIWRQWGRRSTAAS